MFPGDCFKLYGPIDLQDMSKGRRQTDSDIICFLWIQDSQVGVGGGHLPNGYQGSSRSPPFWGREEMRVRQTAKVTGEWSPQIDCLITLPRAQNSRIHNSDTLFMLMGKLFFLIIASFSLTPRHIYRWEKDSAGQHAASLEQLQV